MKQGEPIDDQSILASRFRNAKESGSDVKLAVGAARKRFELCALNRSVPQGAAFGGLLTLENL